MLWRGGVREERLELGNVLTIAGLIVLVPAMVGVVFVITAFIFNLTAAVGVTTLLVLFFVLLWFVLPYCGTAIGEGKDRIASPRARAWGP
jgi:hypothetical protein